MTGVLRPAELLVRTNPKKLRLVLLVTVIILFLGAGIFAIGFGAGKATSQRIQITKIWSDQVDAPSSMIYYLVDVNASNNSPMVWHLDPSLFIIESNALKAYLAADSYNETTLLGKADVAPGRYILGMIAFELPTNQVPLRLNYTDSAGGIALDTSTIPAVSAVASRFDYNVRLTVNGEPVATGGWATTTTNGTYSWVGSLIANGVILNNSLVFFSGQTVQVNLWFEYLRKPADPTSIKLVSATNGDAYTVIGKSSLPVTMTGWASQAGVDFLLKVPPGQHTGSLSFSVQFSP